MKVRLLPSAVRDLDEIDAHVTVNFGSAIADRTLDRLFATFQRLAEFPNIGEIRTDVTTRPIRFFLTKPYWIAYEPGEPFTIHRVYHAARDLARLPKS